MIAMSRNDDDGGSKAHAVALAGSSRAVVDAGVESSQRAGAVDVADLAHVVGVVGATPVAAGPDGRGADGAGGHALVVVLELVGSAGSGRLTLTVQGLVAAGATDAEVGSEAGLAVGAAGLASAAERVGVVVGSAVLDADSVEEVLAIETGNSLSHSSGVPGASTETVVVVSAEASSEDAQSLVEEEARVANPLTNSVAAYGLAVVALSGRHASLGRGVDEEAADALSAGVDVSGALGAVGVARLADAVDGGEARLAAGHTLTVADDSGKAGADVVSRHCAGGTALLALVVEVVEAAQTAPASSPGVASGTGVGALRADTASWGDGSVLATGAVVEGRAGLAVGRASHTPPLVVVVVLSGQAALLADGAGSDVATSALNAVLRSPLTAVATGRAGNAHSGEGELVLTTPHGTGSLGSD